MKAEDWIKVEDRLPECTFGDRETMHYSRNVLVAMRWINGCSSYWVIRIACYDKILDQWLDHNDIPYEAVEYAEARYDLDYCGNVRDILNYLKSFVEE